MNNDLSALNPQVAIVMIGVVGILALTAMALDFNVSLCFQGNSVQLSRSKEKHGYLEPAARE